MEYIIGVLVVVYFIYSKGKKQGRREGNRGAYAAGRAAGARKVTLNEKGGCLGVLLLMVFLTSLVICHVV